MGDHVTEPDYKTLKDQRERLLQVIKGLSAFTKTQYTHENFRGMCDCRRRASPRVHPHARHIVIFALPHYPFSLIPLIPPRRLAHACSAFPAPCSSSTQTSRWTRTRATSRSGARARAPRVHGTSAAAAWARQSSCGTTPLWHKPRLRGATPLGAGGARR